MIYIVRSYTNSANGWLSHRMRQESGTNLYHQVFFSPHLITCLACRSLVVIIQKGGFLEWWSVVIHLSMDGDPQRLWKPRPSQQMCQLEVASSPTRPAKIL